MPLTAAAAAAAAAAGAAGAAAGIQGGYQAINQLLQQYQVPISNLSYAYTSGPVWEPGDEIGVVSHFTNNEMGAIIPLSALPLNQTAFAAAVAKYAGLYMQVRFVAAIKSYSHSAAAAKA
jgi:hypothetical protein